jgi:hypothetical protein
MPMALETPFPHVRWNVRVGDHPHFDAGSDFHFNPVAKITVATESSGEEHGFDGIGATQCLRGDVNLDSDELQYFFNDFFENVVDHLPGKLQLASMEPQMSIWKMCAGWQKILSRRVAGVLSLDVVFKSFHGFSLVLVVPVRIVPKFLLEISGEDAVEKNASA